MTYLTWREKTKHPEISRLIFYPDSKKKVGAQSHREGQRAAGMGPEQMLCAMSILKVGTEGNWKESQEGYRQRRRYLKAQEGRPSYFLFQVPVNSLEA